MASDRYAGTRTLYIKREDPAGKDLPVITEHFVWDKDLFLSRQRELYTAEPRAKGKTSEIRIISVATAEEYRRFRDMGRKTS